MLSNFSFTEERRHRSWPPPLRVSLRDLPSAAHYNSYMVHFPHLVYETRLIPHNLFPAPNIRKYMYVCASPKMNSFPRIRPYQTNTIRNTNYSRRNCSLVFPSGLFCELACEKRQFIHRTGTCINWVRTTGT